MPQSCYDFSTVMPMKVGHINPLDEQHDYDTITKVESAKTNTTKS